MSCKDKMVVDGVTFVKEVPSDSPVRIVVLQRGWVCVGRYEVLAEDAHILRDASVIRVWGTSKGLGELTAGPTSKTVLDKAGAVRFHPLAVVLTIDAEESSWAARL